MDYKNFFEPLENTMPFFKMALEGSAGSGKTYTASLIAIGLYKKIKSQKPVIIFDTEKSSKFLKPMFQEHGIEVLLKQSRTLADLVKTMEFCNTGNSDILIIDSITHVWEQFLSDYQKSTGRSYLQFQDWGKIKPAWKRDYSDRLVNANAHIFFTGREGFTYDYEEINGKKELVKTGVKMKAEGETAYEPDVLVRMERFERILDQDDKEVWREATVIKDRSNITDGKTFKNPSFSDFSPILDFLLGDTAPKVTTVSYPNDDIIGDQEVRNEDTQERKILLERNEALVNQVAAGTSGDAKAMKLALLDYAYYGETSETAIASMSKGQLEEANNRLTGIVKIIKGILRGEPKVYPLAKVVDSAREKYLESKVLAENTPEQLQAYLDHIVEKYKAINDKENTNE